MNGLLMVPQYSELEHREDVDLSSRLRDIELAWPILSAPMDSVTGLEMAFKMAREGGLGVIHRYQTIAAQVEMVRLLREEGLSVGAAVGVSGDSMKRALDLICEGCNLIVLDVAHGDTRNVLDFIYVLKKEAPLTSVTSGNIVTPAAARRSLAAGVDILKVGIGNGFACTTQADCGVGFPQLQAVQEIAAEVKGWKPIVSDGGCRTPGDIVQALASGASAVMLGWMLSGLDEALLPGEYRGMASQEALAERKQEFFSEGKNIEAARGLSIDKIRLGMKYSMSYLGARNLEELRKRVRWVE